MTNLNKSLAFVFPGQGSQWVGMLKEMAEKTPLIQATFEEASVALGMDLWALTQQGPENLLNQTENTQPALLTASVALWRLWGERQGSQPRLLAGHSLGEYTALVCSKAIAFDDAVKLVRERGRLMQAAVAADEGAMAAILGLDDALLEAVCLEAAMGEVVSPANFNSIGQTVIAGNKTAVMRAIALAKTKGAKRALLLPVSVPSHCALMKPAAIALGEYLTKIRISAPLIPLLHNVDADFCSHPDDIRERLVLQLYRPVHWVKTIQRFAEENIQSVIECGPGKVLTGLIKRIDTAIKPLNIDTPIELETVLNAI